MCNEGIRPAVQPNHLTSKPRMRCRSRSRDSSLSRRQHRSPSNDTTRHYSSGPSVSHSPTRASSSPVDTSRPFRERSSSKASSSPLTIPKKTVSGSSTDETYIVYIPDLPADKTDTQLEKMIHDRLNDDPQIRIVAIKCYPRFSVGVLGVQNKSSADRLLLSIQSIVLNPPYDSIITFSDTLELISYIVFDPTVKNMPTKDEVLQRWMKVYKSARPETCEPVSTLYSNIFRIVSTSFDDLLHASSIADFAVNNNFATVYFRADCSYFEDLPAIIRRDDLFTAITNKIGLRASATTELYIQYQHEARNAIVLASGPARKWIHETFLHIGAHILPKKVQMAHRVLLQPVPPSCPLQSILQHQLFENSIINHHRKEESVVLEINDKTLYEKILNIGAVKIGEHRIFIDIYSALNDPEGTEITAENWYATRMLDVDPDIMPFIVNKHGILHYSWNAKIWSEQKQKIDDRNQLNKDQNRIRHLLRMTVMLNTIGVIRKKSYTLEGQQVVQLRDEPLKTIVYHHQSKLFPGRKVSSSKDVLRFSLTTVEVVERDCLEVYYQLASSGRRPLLLNMANQKSPGGGYRRGDGAQEENLFRRSNYCLSLDVEMDELNRSERFHCGDDGQLKTFFKSDPMYPMGDFGAVYTSGITVFRHSEDRGYGFLSEPAYGVCAIAMAAFREPKLDNQMLTGRAAAGMRKKIENIFAIAHHQNHDCLVLSALGCGAFRNPPQHVAALFKSVIIQYAGYFRSIHFAIIDDHNTGNRLNPQGNFLPFQKELDALTVHSQSLESVNMASGPFRLLNKVESDKQLDLSDVYIFELTPCRYGAQCHELYDTQHIKSFSHPPACFHQTTCKNMDDNVHMFSFIHRTRCRDGGECEKTKDEQHLHQYEHPQPCPQCSNCTDMNSKHLNDYLHVVPLCPQGLKCTHYIARTADHLQAYRHCRQKCSREGLCAKFHDEQHRQDYDHPFLPPCPFTPFHCKLHNQLMKTKNLEAMPSDNRAHFFKCAHVCPLGRQCNDTSESHTQIFIHVPRQMCTHKDRCKKTNNEQHLNSFSHPNIHDIRELCDYPGYQCRDRHKIDHQHRFRHSKNHDYMGIGRYFALNRRTDFLRNQNEINRILHNYLDTHKWRKSPTISSNIIDWVRALQPVHRCSKVTFESILVHNHLMSRAQMNLLREPRFVANAVVQHGHFRHIFKDLNNPTLEGHARDFAQAIVSDEFAKNSPVEHLDLMIAMRTALKPTSSSVDQQYTIQMKENILRQNLSQTQIETIRSCATDITQASLKLSREPMGIGHVPDKALGTDKHVFSILGPHSGHYGPIVLIFKRELMYHPDSNFSIQAATSFYSGNGYQWREWLRDPVRPEERVKTFHHSKLHCSIPDYESAAALQLIASAGSDEKTTDVDLKTILKWWKKVDSHMVFESHLPQLIPLDYIDHVYMPRQIFNSLSPNAQQATRSIFRHALTISDETGQAYESFVYNEMIKRIEHNMEKGSLPQGMIVTLPASSFYEHVGLPMTIKQSCELFSHNKSKSGPRHRPEMTLIYWQAMYGDMMVTLSTEPVDCTGEQPNLRCLLCYVAEVPLTSSPDYHESYSYLTNDHPLKHSVISRQAKYKKGSCRFYRGVNTDDYLTFCLKIEYSENRVSLSHAGANSLYDHEVIVAKFTQGELDLTKLNYVHVSAGNGTVPVKNMIIRHEPISDFHPSFDTNFKGSGASSTSTASTAQGSQASSGPSDSKKDGFFTKLTNAARTVFSSSSLKLCPDSVNCLRREDPDHNQKYSHPCRYSELCRNISGEPHLTHAPHKVPNCRYDPNCRLVADPIHRASYRHAGLADFLIPCRYQKDCRTISPGYQKEQSPKSLEHRKIYSHGERVPPPDNSSSD